MNQFWFFLGIALLVLFLLNTWMTSKKGYPASADQKAGGPWVVYGSNKCGWTRKQIQYMDSNDIDYTFVDCDEDGKQCTGIASFPTIKANDGTVSLGYFEM